MDEVDSTGLETRDWSEGDMVDDVSEDEMIDAYIKWKPEAEQDRLEEAISSCLKAPTSGTWDADMLFDFAKFRKIYKR